jgi:malonyl-CoA/methylmalonyl-CoA synthetase
LAAVVTDAAAWDAPAAPFREPPVGPGDACLMLYSSGTTGRPKGVVHTPANLSASLRALQSCWRLTAEDVVVNALPLFHIHGLSFALHMSLITGATVILEEAFHPTETLDVVGKGTVFMAVPTIYYRFLEQPSFAEKARGWKNVRLFTCGSAPIRADVLPTLESILGHPVINRYGMTEAHVITSLPLDGPWPYGSVGTPLNGIEMRVLRQDGTSAAAGETGSVAIRGPNLFREYWNNPEATRKAFASGWFDTGDLGYLDERGFLFLVGRSNDLIITSGYNVYPQVVERAINECPGVRESAVVGIPDAIRGESVAAFVVRDDPALDEERVLAFLSDRVIDYQRPRQVIFLDALPRNAMGKVLRTELSKLAGKGVPHSTKVKDA